MCLLSVPFSGWIVLNLHCVCVWVYMIDTALGHMTSVQRLHRGCENKHAGVLEIREGSDTLPPTAHTHTHTQQPHTHDHTQSLNTSPGEAGLDSHAPGPVSTLNAISQPHVRQHGK